MDGKVIEAARKALAGYGADIDVWVKANEEQNDAPSVRDCERYSDAMENNADWLASTLSSILDELDRPGNQWIVRVVGDKAYTGLTTRFVGPFATKNEAIERADNMETLHIGMGTEAYVEELHAP
jgi:hypothetical protein